MGLSRYGAIFLNPKFLYNIFPCFIEGAVSSLKDKSCARKGIFRRIVYEWLSNMFEKTFLNQSQERKIKMSKKLITTKTYVRVHV